MKHSKPSQTEKLYEDIDTIVEKLGNIVMRTQEVHQLHGPPLAQQNHIIQYLQAELRYMKIRSDSAKQEEQIRNLRSMIGLDMRKYRGE
tara:strand:+ start:338 stop:604 length:267 start_codon:yes stop_codon:yes gene_type:complete